ncbi:hypothetical protein LTR56_025976 [Elasticomyces elasticus]|nr:hypothetical protein LTR56_025976 [Elasticomyces elasticus]
MCLAELYEGQRYLALSYMWGCVRSLTANSSNWAELERPGGIGMIFAGLPTVIQNAITLTKSLGIRYIWIDSLCVMQDAAESWETATERMLVLRGRSLLSGEESMRPLAADQQVIVKYSATDADLELMLSWPLNSYVEHSRWFTAHGRSKSASFHLDASYALIRDSIYSVVSRLCRKTSTPRVRPLKGVLSVQHGPSSFLAHLERYFGVFGTILLVFTRIFCAHTRH